MNWRPGAIALLLFTVAAAQSVALDAGLVCSNDGAHYALVRALADEHTVVIDNQIRYTQEIDYSQRGGHRYSDRAPGTAFLALPFYVAARAFGGQDYYWQVVTALACAVAGALCVVLVFLLGRRIGLQTGGAVAGALTLMLCTPHRSYSTSLWSHAPAACLTALAALLATPREGEPDAPTSALGRLALGLACGYAVVVDYSAALVGAVVLLAVAVPALRRRHFTAIGLLAAGALIGLAPALVYHTIAFGSPLATPYQYHNQYFANTRTLRSLYGGRFFDGLGGLLFSWRAGLLLYSPILVAGIWATPRLCRRLGARRAAVLVGPWVAMLLLTAKHVTWDGGAAHDARYLMPIIPLLCLAVGAAFDRVRTHIALLSGFAGLFFTSAVIQLVKHAIGWARNPTGWIIEFGQIAKTTGHFTPTLARFIDWLFPHPLPAAVVLAVGLAAAVLLARRKPRGRSVPEAAVLAPAQSHRLITRV